MPGMTRRALLASPLALPLLPAAVRAAAGIELLYLDVRDEAQSLTSAVRNATAEPVRPPLLAVGFYAGTSLVDAGVLRPALPGPVVPPDAPAFLQLPLSDAAWSRVEVSLPEPQPPLDPERMPPAGLEVRGFVVAGEPPAVRGTVENTADTPVALAWVAALLFDANGHFAAAAHESAGPTVLAPGESAPFAVATPWPDVLPGWTIRPAAGAAPPARGSV